MHMSHYCTLDNCLKTVASLSCENVMFVLGLLFGPLCKTWPGLPYYSGTWKSTNLHQAPTVPSGFTHRLKQTKDIGLFFIYLFIFQKQRLHSFNN